MALTPREKQARYRKRKAEREVVDRWISKAEGEDWRFRWALDAFVRDYMSRRGAALNLARVVDAMQKRGEAIRADGALEGDHAVRFLAGAKEDRTYSAQPDVPRPAGRARRWRIRPRLQV